jgi:hypothetical protein
MCGGRIFYFQIEMKIFILFISLNDYLTMLVQEMQTLAPQKKIIEMMIKIF